MAFYEKTGSLTQAINTPNGPVVVNDKRLPGMRLRPPPSDSAERKIVRPIYPNYGPSYDYTVKDQDEIIFTLNSLDPRVMLNMDKSALIVGVYLVFPDDATYWTDVTKTPQSGLRYTFLAQPLLTSDVKGTGAFNIYCDASQARECDEITMGGWACDYKYGSLYYRNVAALHNEFIWRGTHTLFQRIQIKNINSSRIVEEINLADVLTHLSLSSLPEDAWHEMSERYGCSYWRPVPCVPCGSETNTIISNSGSGPCLNIGAVGTSATAITGTSSVVVSSNTTDLAVSYCGLFCPGTNNLQVNETYSASMTADSVTFRTTNFTKQLFPQLPAASWVGVGAGTSATTTATDLGSYPITSLNATQYGYLGAFVAGTSNTLITATANYSAQSFSGSGTTSANVSSTKHCRIYDKGPENAETYKLLLSSKTNCAEWEYLLPSEYLRNGQLIWLKPEAFELRLQFNNPNDVFHIKRFGNWWAPDASHPKTKLPPTYYNDDLMYPVIHVYNCRINACFETFSESTVAMLQQAWSSDIGIVKDFDSWWTFKPNDIAAGSSNASIMIQANDIHNMKSVFIVLCRRANIAATGEDKYHFSTGEFYGNCNPLRTDTGYVNSLQFFVGNDPYPESPVLMSPIKRVEMREYVREALHGGSLLKVKDGLLDDLFLGYSHDPLFVLDQRSTLPTVATTDSGNTTTTSYGGMTRLNRMENSYCSGLNCNFMMAYDFRRHDQAYASGLNLEGRNLYINLTFAGTSKVALVPYVFICAEKSLVLKPTITSVLT